VTRALCRSNDSEPTAGGNRCGSVRAMAIDTSRWRLPGFVDQAACRDDQDESYLASRGVAVLRSDRPAAVGQQAAIEVHLFGALGWGIIKGLVSEVRSDGQLVVGATLTSDGSDLLDRAWDIRLRRDAEGFDGAWVVETMMAEGVVTVPRRWPRMLVERLRATGDLLLADSDLDPIINLVRGRSLEYASMTTARECAAFTARALVRAFEQAGAVEEIFLGSEELGALLVDLWCSEGAGGYSGHGPRDH
jgi:hypothetical protein